MTGVAQGAPVFDSVSIPSRTGERLDAVYAPPPAHAAPAPAIVMLHGCGGMFTKSGKLKAIEKAWIDIVHAQGWAALIPDSFKSRGYDSLCGIAIKDRPVTPGRQRRFDAMGALDFLAARPEIDASKIVVLGWSNGAMTAMKLVRSGQTLTPKPGEPDFLAAVLFYPGCEAEYRANPQYTARMPTLVQLGGNDDWALPKPCIDMFTQANTRAPLVDIEVYPGAYHSFDAPNSVLRQITVSGGKQVHVGTDIAARTKAIDKTVSWLKAQFQKSPR